MAANPVHVKEASPTFVSSDAVSCNSVCQCCSFLKSGFQVFTNEIKSMTEIINVLKEELKYDSATKQEPISDSACEGKPKISSLQCYNFSQL
jgi:hypothetical protein